MNAENYKDAFQAAVQKTMEWNLGEDLPFSKLEAPPISREMIFQITPNLIPQLVQHGFVDSHSLAGNCIQVNAWLADLLAYFGVKSVMTIGSMCLEHGYVYMPLDYEKLHAELNAPQPDKDIGVHVWLTLEDGSIVDWVGPAWYDQKIGKNYPVNECLDVLSQGVFDDSPYSYKPYLVGSEYLKKTGAIRSELIMR